MNHLRHLLIALVALALVAALAILYDKTQAVDLRLRNDVASLLDTLREIDGRWDIDVLRERSELDPNQPAAPNRTATAKRALDSLNALAPQADSAALREGLGALGQAVLEKAEVVEKHKAESAAAKIALHTALAGAAELGAQPGAVRGADTRQRNLDQAVGQLVAAAQEYYWLGKASDPARLQMAASALEEQAAAVSDAARAQTGAIGGAVQELLRHKPLEEELFAKVSSLSAGPRLDRMSFGLNRELESTLQEKELFRVYLLAYAVALLLGVGYIGIRLRSAKEDLEQRLAERTRELAEALLPSKASGT